MELLRTLWNVAIAPAFVGKAPGSSSILNVGVSAKVGCFSHRFVGKVGLVGANWTETLHFSISPTETFFAGFSVTEFAVVHSTSDSLIVAFFYQIKA